MLPYPSVMVDDCNPSAQKPEAEGSLTVWDEPRLHSEIVLKTTTKKIGHQITFESILLDVVTPVLGKQENQEFEVILCYMVNLRSVQTTWYRVLES